MTIYAGPLLPLGIFDSRGRAVSNAQVEVLNRITGAPVALYLDVHRTLAPRPYTADADGNFDGYYAEPGEYRVRAGQHPEVTTAAVLAPEEADFIRQQAGPSGAQGAQGPVGPTGERGPFRWRGHGPPTTIIGSRVNDEYVDLDTGTLYVLD